LPLVHRAEDVGNNHVPPGTHGKGQLAHRALLLLGANIMKYEAALCYVEAPVALDRVRIQQIALAATQSRAEGRQCRLAPDLRGKIGQVNRYDHHPAALATENVVGLLTERTANDEETRAR
jgi:hypothetical protein